MNKITWLIFCAITGLFFFYIGTTVNSPSLNRDSNISYKNEDRDRFEAKLKSSFTHGYDTKLLSVGESFISASFVSYTSKSITQYVDTLPCDPYLPGRLPNPLVYENIGNTLPRSYEIGLGGSCITNYDFFTLDLDGDGTNEIISKWEASSGGSGGQVGFVTWKVDPLTGLRPLAGLPGDDSDLSIKRLEDNSSTRYPALSTWDYFKYDFTNEKVMRINVARMVWDTTPTKNDRFGESHSSPHIWHLTSYIFEKDKFVVDPNWNDGEEYVTDHKIEPFEAGAIEIDKLFIKLRK